MASWPFGKHAAARLIAAAAWPNERVESRESWAVRMEDPADRDLLDRTYEMASAQLLAAYRGLAGES